MAGDADPAKRWKEEGWTRWSVVSRSKKFFISRKNNSVKRYVESNRLVLCLTELYAQLCRTDRRTFILWINVEIFQIANAPVSRSLFALEICPRLCR